MVLLSHVNRRHVDNAGTFSAFSTVFVFFRLGQTLERRREFLHLDLFARCARRFWRLQNRNFVWFSGRALRKSVWFSCRALTNLDWSMQGSVIQAEITEQVRLLKEEWRVTVEKMSKAMAEVRSALVQATLPLTNSAPLPYFFHTNFSQVPHSGSRMSRTELKEVAWLTVSRRACISLNFARLSFSHAHTQLIASSYADEGLGTEKNEITSGGARGATQTTAAT